MPVTKKRRFCALSWLIAKIILRCTVSKTSKFQVVHSLTYLWSDLTCNNGISGEIEKRILAANRCFHGLRKHLKSHLTSKNTKALMYKVLIRPVLTYASETWILSKTNERRF